MLLRELNRLGLSSGAAVLLSQRRRADTGRAGQAVLPRRTATPCWTSLPITWMRPDVTSQPSTSGDWTGASFWYPRPGLSGRLHRPHAGPEPYRPGGGQGELFRLVPGKGRRDQRETAQNEALRRDPAPGAGVPPDLPLVRPGGARANYGSQNSGLRPDRGYLGHKSAKLMQRGKNLEVRQQGGHPGKDRAAPGCGAGGQSEADPLRHHSQRLLEGRDLVVLHGGRALSKPPGQLHTGAGAAALPARRKRQRKNQPAPPGAGEELEHTGSLRRTSGLVVSYVPSRWDGSAAARPPWRRAGFGPHPIFYRPAEARFFPAHAGAGYGGVQRGPAEEAPAGRQPVPERPPLCGTSR